MLTKRNSQDLLAALNELQFMQKCYNNIAGIVSFSADEEIKRKLGNHLTCMKLHMREFEIQLTSILIETPQNLTNQQYLNLLVSK